ncbi:hypothetical protein Pan5_16 [Pseudanabaena phage Pan5]|nr:hypothetical protein Pan5_16 [Pseudanabaena phage Pan5]
MASNIVVHPKIGPVKWVIEGATNDARYKTKRFDRYRYQDTVKEWMEQRNWFQPWTTADSVTIQLQSNFAPFALTVIDSCTGATMLSTTIDYVATSIEASGLKVYQKTISLAGLPSGSYYFRLRCGSPVLITYVSEAFVIGTWPDSILLEYSHNENDYDVIWETGIVMNYRVPGGFREYQPGNESTVFVDQDQDLIQLSARTFHTERLIIGTSEGVPDWVAERVNKIFQCATVLADGLQYVRNDGATLEASREDDYPLVGWSLEVRPKDAAGALVDTVTPTDNPSSVVYNIDTRGFGTITTDGTIAQIISIN